MRPDHPLRTGLPPDWAASWGEDAYGPFAAFVVREVEHRMRWIPPGRFWMGSPEGEAGRYAYEGPRHEVLLTRGFWLGETPVTQQLWQAVTGQNPSRFVSARRPVEQVSWEYAQRFCVSLAEHVAGLHPRLPSEAEWERACRAETDGATWVGELTLRGENDAPELDAIAWYGGNSGDGFELADGYVSSGWPNKQINHARAGTREVGLKAPNPWGLRDVLGNVLEWCEDAWNYGKPYPGGERVDPLSAVGTHRVIRGGSWYSRARYVRAAYRGGNHPGYRSDHLGLRLAAGPRPAPPAQPGAAQE